MDQQNGPDDQPVMFVIQSAGSGTTATIYNPEQHALRYIWHKVILKDKDYISLARMSRHTGLSYDKCETFVAKFHAEHKIPRLTVIEEMEG